MDPVRVARERERLKGVKTVVVLTGAGVSAESGIPTFRGSGGLWKNFRAEELATPEAFRRDPLLVWQWYDWRRGVVAAAYPNGAHLSLARAAASSRFDSFKLITQNVDGLHSLAGSRDVIELHGSIWRLRCVSCEHAEENRDVPLKLPPRCACGALLRPGVVWFGESLDEADVDAAFEAVSAADYVLVVGTSGVVQPAASLARAAKGAGARVVEVNVEETGSVADELLIGKAGEILPELLK